VRLLVSGLLTLTVAAGCGEDTIPLAEYVERANAICRDNNTRGRAEIDRFRKQLEADGELEPDEIAELNRKTLEIARPGLDRLTALPPPEEREDTAEAYERASREANEAVEDVIDAYEEGDAKRLRDAIARNKARGQDSKEAAADLGLDACTVDSG
jgi:hypothetical protein